MVKDGIRATYFIFNERLPKQFLMRLRGVIVNVARNFNEMVTVTIVKRVKDFSQTDVF